MKVSTPSISWHNRERISSVDFQGRPWPNDKYRRLASGGDDKHVVIWDWSESLSCLADLSRHQNSVNTVRWSKDGKLLASGDTDSAIYLWHYQELSLAPDLFGDVPLDEDSSPGETWSVWKILRGHLQDVVSLDWSSCGSFIVSSSTDNTAIIFDVLKGTKLKILSEHKGWVNGVSFDPLGKFVTSICSDRSLRVFTTKSYKTVSRTAKCRLPIPKEHGGREDKGVRLFHDDTFQSFYRRLDFSPDGQLLVVPSGVLEIEQEASISHCTYIFSRTNFSKPVLYLPNKEFSVAVRFCPLLFELRPVPNDEEMEREGGEELKPWDKYKTMFALPYRMVFAVATQNTVMFYDTQQSTPFARVSKVHYIGLTDLSWSPDGLTCIVSSTDGYASFIEFQKEELGRVYTPLKTDKLEEISVNVPLKSNKHPSKKDKTINSSMNKSSTPSKPSTTTIPVRKASKETSQSIGGGNSGGKTQPASFISVRKIPKESSQSLEGPERRRPLEKDNQQPAAFISVRKAPKELSGSSKEQAAKTIEIRKVPREECKKSTVQEVKSGLPKPFFDELVQTPVSSGTALPSKSPKRVQLVTLSVPEKEDVEMYDEEENENLPLLLEDESPLSKDCT